MQEVLASLLVKNALFLKSGESIRRKDFCPFITEIARGIPACKNVREAVLKSNELGDLINSYFIPDGIEKA